MGGTRSARVIESRAPVTASRTRTHRTLTVQRAVRSHMVACSGSSLAQTIGAIGPSRARRTSLMRMVSGGRRQLVAAVGAAGADDEAGLAEADDELLQVGARQVLLGGDLGERGRAGPVVAGRAGPSAARRTRPSSRRRWRRCRGRWALGGGRGKRSGSGPRYPSDFVGISLRGQSAWSVNRVRCTGAGGQLRQIPHQVIVRRRPSASLIDQSLSSCIAMHITGAASDLRGV